MFRILGKAPQDSFTLSVSVKLCRWKNCMTSDRPPLRHRYTTLSWMTVAISCAFYSGIDRVISWPKKLSSKIFSNIWFRSVHLLMYRKYIHWHLLLALLYLPSDTSHLCVTLPPLSSLHIRSWYINVGLIPVYITWSLNGPSLASTHSALSSFILLPLNLWI